MLSALVILSGTRVQTPLIAYSCRYYYPSGDKRTSYHQIYLCDLHGRHRRQITFDRSEHTAVRWVGRGEIAWLETDGVGRDDDVGYHFPANRASRIVLYDLKSKRKRVVANGNFDPDGWYEHLNNEGRGVAVFYWDSSLVPVSQDTECVVVGSHSVKLHGRPPRPKYAGARYGPDRDDTVWAPCTLTQEASGKYFTAVSRHGASMGWGAVKLSRHRRTIQVPENAEFIWKGADGWPEWFSLLSRAASAGSDEWIYRLDWKHGKCVALTHDTLNIDFDPASRYWAASSDGRPSERCGFGPGLSGWAIRETESSGPSPPVRSAAIVLASSRINITAS